MFRVKNMHFESHQTSEVQQRQSRATYIKTHFINTDVCIGVIKFWGFLFFGIFDCFVLFFVPNQIEFPWNVIESCFYGMIN